jgi:hypothetical protein
MEMIPTSSIQTQAIAMIQTLLVPKILTKSASLLTFHV